MSTMKDAKAYSTYKRLKYRPIRNGIKYNDIKHTLRANQQTGVTSNERNQVLLITTVPIENQISPVTVIARENVTSEERR